MTGVIFAVRKLSHNEPGKLMSATVSACHI